MIQVVLSFQDGQTQEVLLAGVPRKDEAIRLRNGHGTPQLIVDHVLWVEGEGTSPEPVVIVSVVERRVGPTG